LNGGQQKFPEISVATTFNVPPRHRSFNTAWIGLNYTASGKSAVQLFFALLFSSIQSFFCEKNYLNFSL
jgi:hypothetical protein